MRFIPLLVLPALLLGAGLRAASAEESCNVPASAMMSKADMIKSLQDRGYVKIRNLSTHNGCYEAKGFDRNGKRFELELNGQNGQIVNAE
jgi:hypothetical protein